MKDKLYAVYVLPLRRMIYDAWWIARFAASMFKPR